MSSLVAHWWKIRWSQWWAMGCTTITTILEVVIHLFS